MAAKSSSQGCLDRHWYGKPDLLLLLYPVEIIYRCLILIRRFLFKKNILSSWRSPVPVIVVGNISVGGVGKTPLVIALVEFLQAQGYQPGVVSRGYGGKPSQSLQTVEADSSPAEVGDESLLIVQRTACPCVVGANRPDAVRKLLAEGRCNVVISDDGLQHYALQRDIEIVVVDGPRQFGNGHCLPVGPLREPRQRLNGVDFTIYNGNREADTMKVVPARWVNLFSGESFDSLPNEEGIENHAICGIGNPQRFYSTLEAQGISFQNHSFADHHDFSADDLSQYQGSRLLMTEKDAVKCRQFATENMWYLSVDAIVSETLLTQLSTRLSAIINQ